MSEKKILCVIPARIGSTRLPEKPLIKIKGVPIVMWTYNAALKSGVFDKICVATDDTRIFDTVTGMGGNAVMTSPLHSSGTDRVNEAASDEPYEYVVNLQGDEPLIPAGLLLTLKKNIIAIHDNSLLTCVSNATIEDRLNPNVVKVVCNADNEALYFSRAAIPFDRDCKGAVSLRHCGIYAFTRSGLAKFCSLPQGELERIEKLEQLRALEHGMKIKCFFYDYRGIGIDTPDDIKAFSEMVEG
jgi:3-deoxy-manno-octulosonate cytidylyltransferase (CMP-KDO synthetase)